MNNHALRNGRRKYLIRRALRGGGYGMGAPLVPFDAATDTSFAIKMPVNQGFSDCQFATRPGQLFNPPNPGLAQVGMAGGQRQRTMRRLRGGACGCMARRQRGGSRTRRIRGGACGCMARRQRGGAGGFAVDPSVSVGGSGPNAAPLHSAVPCDARGGAPNPFNPIGLGADPRAPADLYSLTPNQSVPTVQAGGAYSSGNEFSAGCYKAPGSELPVYEAQTAGFTFRPSTEIGGALPDGVTAYNNVVQYAARLGGARKSRKSKSRKSKSRKSKSSKNRKH